MEFINFKDFPLKTVGLTTGLVGAIYGDDENLYLVHFPEFDVEARFDNLTINLVEMVDGAWKNLLRQSDLVETEVLAKSEDGKTIKAIVRKCQRNIEQTVSWTVWDRDGYACRYCGRTHDSNGKKIPLTVDHLVLWEEGGPSTEENLVTACKKCNKKRGNTQYAEWLNHPYYLRAAEGLSQDVRQKNLDVVGMLDGIPRMLHVRSRR